MENINLRISLIVLAILAVSASSVFAGVNSPYWGGSNPNPLKMHPGETKDVFFNLQNCPDLAANCAKKDDIVIVSLIEGSEIAQITSGESYTIPYGTADKYITVQVSVPENAKAGDSYNVKFSTSSSSGGSGGSVQLSTGYYVDFPVQVIAEAFEPESTSTETPISEKSDNKIVLWTAGGVFIIVAIIIIIILINQLSRRKEQV